MQGLIGQDDIVRLQPLAHGRLPAMRLGHGEDARQKLFGGVAVSMVADLGQVFGDSGICLDHLATVDLMGVCNGGLNGC